MINVVATMWPRGNAAEAYELLHATISNRSELDDANESYMAYVLARPNVWMGIGGYEADVEVKDHKRAAGFAPLLMSVLNAAHVTVAPIALPPARALARMTIQDAADFERRLKART